MNSNNPLETSQKHEAEVAEHGNGHDTEKFISTAQHDEKGIHPLDSGGTSDDGSDFKVSRPHRLVRILIPYSSPSNFSCLC